MMDFLRGLAPPREGDPNRAVAVLPSRFSTQNPLRAGVVEPPPPDGDDVSANDTAPEFQREPAASIADVPRSRPAAPRRVSVETRIDALAGPGAAPRDSGDTPLHHEDTRATAPQQAYALDASHVVRQAQPRLQRSDGVDSRAASTANARVADAATLAHDAHAPDAVRSRPVLTAPLSAAGLAQRAAQARNQDTLIHVSIGRIDVVAAGASPPAAAPRTQPRRPTVALADYLRAGKDGAR